MPGTDEADDAEKPDQGDTEKPDNDDTAEEPRKAKQAKKSDEAEKKKEKKSDEAEKKKKEKKSDEAEKKEKKQSDEAEKKEKKKSDEAEKKEKKKSDEAEKKKKEKKSDEAEKKDKKSDESKKATATGDIKWNPELEKACWQKSEGVIISSTPFVDKDGEVKVLFGGLLWNVPHLVPSDLDPSMPANPPQQQMKAKAVPKAKQLKPVDDYVYPIIRCKYCTQGTKNPLIKIEVREDRHNLQSKWVQKLQLVIKDNLSVRKAMNVAKSFADSFVYMNLNPGRLNFRGCRESLLAHEHDWETSALDWQTVNKLGLKHFPKSQLELWFVSTFPGLLPTRMIRASNTHASCLFTCKASYICFMHVRTCIHDRTHMIKSYPHTHTHTHTHRHSFMHHACIHTYLGAYIHTYVHTYIDDTRLHTYIPDPRPNDSPIKMARQAQTEIAKDEEKPAKGDAAADDDDNEEGDEEEDHEDDPAIEPGETEEGS